MAMFPIFTLGLLTGVIATIIYFKIQKDTPSKYKIEWLKKEIERQKMDNELLHNVNNKLYDKIDRIESELNNYKNNK